MKDILANRAKLSSRTKMRLLFSSLGENGVAWTGLMGTYYLASALAERSFSFASQLRLERGLPGMNSPAMNRIIWNSWDWSTKGEEWSPSAEWKQSVVARFMEPNVAQGAAIVEIGPGGGRWTWELQKLASKLTGVDISESCIEECQKSFAGVDNVSFLLGSGSDLDGVSSASIDVIWSFDVFVHINRLQFHSYVSEFVRVLRNGGVGVVHHGAVGGETGGWRSDLSTADVFTILTSAGFEVVEQIDTWVDAGHEFRAGLYDDVVTVFKKVAKDDGEGV